LKTTIKKTSKRYGTTPGIRIKKKNKILVAIDTSGSINQDELNAFFSEIYHIHKQGTEIFIVECDSKIQKKYSYTGVVPKLVYGGGGTDFNEPIYFSNEFYKPDAIIYFTDLQGEVPVIKTRSPLMWMVSKNGIDKDSETWNIFEGRKIKMG
ncbi:VWA-like domain-containing protein, partial [Candidatus Gracilibacteria bacterium]|nr:VWA-like domain-containing protein [Candidatus Gracilibacteria bacterium]